MIEPLQRLVFDTGRLMREHPPVWRHPNKRVLLNIACPSGSSHGGEVGYSRWPAMPLPETVRLTDAADRVTCRENVYDYQPTLPDGAGVEWHVNFADPVLFVAYGSALFAQDEMQVAEHPVLGALKEALDADGRPALTVEHGRPTPVLVTGVERRCRIATARNAAEGRPDGLYGNAFPRADGDAIRRATARLEPPTITNLIAMAAPSGGWGAYRAGDVEYILTTAFTGFRAAVLESTRDRERRPQVVVHTGYWGCGAFGGNRVLMAALQAIAARLAEVDRLVFHTVEPAGTRALEEALATVRQLTGNAAMALTQLLQRIVDRGFEWGVSDGT